MKKLFAIAAVMVLSSSAFAGNIAAGKAKSVVCAGCHGPEGISSNPMWPNLAGQKAPYLVKQLQDFKNGTRKDPMMGAMAAPLSTADMNNLAAYYASLSSK